ncbi:DUF851 domain-containing protein [Caenorhabditis elegans]|uniref:Uncharacterized protein n=1 Tax=Caenorhabditis elegans TaxID=6239 RepID=A8WFG3_CAEEL|nr:Uncharacterized protein CELE_C45G9.15 [Caenorhabditis elegans]CCD67404.1 Uncharacterized protein CELE_C45G9.15 [Caenorhabditis elegans]|eukprot:NP_001122689.1 Uncharacterized protein CELE_C45G9.15 [Caenorhabditis elegans]
MEKKTKTGSKKVTRSKKSKKTKRRSSTTVTTTTISNSKPVTPDKDKDSKDQRKQRTKRKDPFEKEWFGKECDDVTRCKVPIQEFKIAEVQLRPRIEEDQNIEVTSRDIDEADMERICKKFAKEKINPITMAEPIDEKTKILLDRVTKKPYPLKYNNEKGLLLFDERSSFYKSREKKKAEKSESNLEEDTYGQVPKLKDVQRLPPQNVFSRPGVPFWAVTLLPTEEDLVDVDPSISVGTEHLEMYHLKQVPLQTIKKSKLILNALQPLSILEDRDDIHFTPELVFSNTIRSLVHAQEMEGKRNESKSDDEGKSDKSLSFVIEKQEEFIYSRANPIETARMARRNRRSKGSSSKK